MDNYVVFEYLYRDASNYKIYGAILLKGAYDENETVSLISHFEGGEFFIPEAIGIPELRSQLYKYGGPNNDDHEYHQFLCLRAANTDDIAELKPHGTFSDFLSTLKHAE